MAFTFLSRFRVKPESDARFVELIGEMEAIARHEPDTLEYRFYRLEEANMFAVYESFTSEQGDAAHQANPANTAIIAEMIECMAGGYQREMLYDVAAAG